MITKYKRNKAAGVAIALLVLAGCGSSDADTSSDPVTTEAGSGTSTSGADEPITTSTTSSTDADPGTSSSTTTDSGGSGDEPADFEGDFPPPEGSTLKRDGFAIGSDGPRQAEFNIADAGGIESALAAYRSTLEGAGFTIGREVSGKGFVADKGELNLQVTARKDYYEDGLVILNVIYQTTTT